MARKDEGTNLEWQCPVMCGNGYQDNTVGNSKLSSFFDPPQLAVLEEPVVTLFLSKSLYLWLGTS